MKLCFLHSGFSIHGGIERVISIIGPELERRKIACVYSLSLVKSEPLEMYHLPKDMRSDYLFSEPINMRSALVKGGIGKLIDYLKKHKIDVIVACGVIFFPLACIAGKLSAVKVLCWEHTNPGKENDVALENVGRWFGALFSDRNILISQSAYDYYCSHYRKKRNMVIYNPAASSLFSDAVKYDEMSHALISVGRLCYQKNYALLIDIAAKLLSNRDDWHWDIYGEGGERGVLEQKIAEKKLQGKVFLKGNVNDLYSRYSQYAAIVMTSRYEGFPMVLIEAAAKGLPMVSFDIKTGPSEIICDGVNGFLLPENDVDGMLEKLELLMKNPDLRKRFSCAAGESVDRFRLDVVCGQWETLLQDIKMKNEKNRVCN